MAMNGTMSYVLADDESTQEKQVWMKTVLKKILTNGEHEVFDKW